MSISTAATSSARRADEAGATRRAVGGRLGNTEIKEQHERIAWSERLWRLQRTMWAVTEIPRLRGCHRWLAPGSAQATVRWRRGEARWGGTQNSRSVWSSPVAAARIARLRSAEVEKALKTWFDQDKQHGAVFVTLTLRHRQGQSLRELWDAISACWRGVTATASWRGGARMIGDKQRFGINHFIKSVEVTHGKSGWHVHQHVILLTDRRLSGDEREALRGRIFSRWSRAAERAGLEAPSVAHGVRVDDAARSTDAGRLGAYVAKGQLGGLANELTAAIGKGGREKTSRTPFQVLSDLSEGKTARDLAIWHEWERDSSGRRQIAWSRGAKEELGVRDLTDEELLAEDDESFDVAAVDLVGVPARVWWSKTDRGQRLCDDVALRNRVLAVAREAVSRADALAQVGAVLTDAGVDFDVLDTDVLPGERPEVPRERVREQRGREARALTRLTHGRGVDSCRRGSALPPAPDIG